MGSDGFRLVRRRRLTSWSLSLSSLVRSRALAGPLVFFLLFSSPRWPLLFSLSLLSHAPGRFGHCPRPTIESIFLSQATTAGTRFANALLHSALAQAISSSFNRSQEKLLMSSSLSHKKRTRKQAAKENI